MLDSITLIVYQEKEELMRFRVKVTKLGFIDSDVSERDARHLEFQACLSKLTKVPVTPLSERDDYSFSYACSL